MDSNPNYEDELILLFYDSMLDLIVDEWTITEEKCDSYQSNSDIEPKISREECQNDLENFSAFDIEGSKALIINDQFRAGSAINNIVKSKSKIDTNGSSTLSFDSNSEFAKHFNSEITQDNFSPTLEHQVPNNPTLLTIQNSSGTLDWFVNAGCEYVTIKFKNGNTYKGFVNRKRFNGHGKFVWSDGVVYEGEFKQGNLTGRGKLFYKDNSYYVGDVCKGLLHGNGTLHLASTNIFYSGEWKRGKQNGKGWILYELQNWYDGEWLDGMRNGKGLRQYNKCSRYQGGWLNNKRHGQGTMVWCNRDYYSGEWKDGLMDGYGEYVWKGFLNTDFVFPILNCYKGQWINSMRSGMGVLHFGFNGGARMAGQWIRNMKHGAGVIVCGNGKTVKGNLLFMYDKPVDTQLFMSGRSVTSVTKNFLLNGKQKGNVIKNSELAPTDKFCDENERDLNRMNVLFEVPIAYSSQVNPLRIPVHSDPKQVDLTYYIQKVSVKYDFEFNVQDDQLGKDTDTQKFLYQKNILKFEEEKLRSAITYDYLVLQSAYQQYATITTRKKIDFRPVLVRLFLWQLYLDAEITREMSLIDTDLCLLENPDCGLESEHYPFENIYFWQFLYSIISVAWELYSKNCDEYKSNGILATMLKKILRERIEPNLGKIKGGALCEYVNILPIQNVYLFYRSLGEPHTARIFFSSCLNKFENICEKLLDERNIARTKKGVNVVIGRLMYVSDDLEIGQKPEDPVSHPFSEDLYRSLHIFMKVKPKQLIKHLSEQCPKIMEDNVIVDMEYKISFLEFYNILIATAVKMIDNAKKLEQMQKETETSLITSSSRVNKSSKRSLVKKKK